MNGFDIRAPAGKESVADEIAEWIEEARQLATDMGLDPFHVNYWIVTNKEMNKLITYGGFQDRYPHWRWGMKYDKQRKQSEHLGGKAFEIVNYDDPAHAFLQVSNEMADQKAVVTHVEAHADFFKNNQWFEDHPNAAERLALNSAKIRRIINRTDVSRSEVENLIDTALCIEDNIDQHRIKRGTEEADTSVREKIENIDIDEDVKDHVFDDDWLDEVDADDGDPSFHHDVLEYLIENGMRYDEEEDRAVEMEEWEKDVLDVVREESYYFAPQRMTKVMNEGWAAYWESIMMSYEGFAGDDEFITYSDHQSRVLNSPGLNPYSLGLAIWQYIENKANRREVIDKLLRVDGINARNFWKQVDFDAVEDMLHNPDSYSPAKRNFSLTRPENRGFLRNVSQEELQTIGRFIVDLDRYDSIGEAMNDVNYSAGWERMREVRETHIDPTFIDQFITEEFIEEENYFTYDFDNNDGQWKVSSTDPKDVKKKLLLQFTNFGKPTIVVEEGNYENSGELLITHKYNGIGLDLREARNVLERIHDIWGRPVNLRTVVKIAEGEEEGREIRYDGDDFTEFELLEQEVEYIMPDEVDYSTRPDDWF